MSAGDPPGNSALRRPGWSFAVVPYLRAPSIAESSPYTLGAGGWGHANVFAGLRLLSLETRTGVRLAADIVAPGGGRSFARPGSLARDVASHALEVQHSTML